jgi:hypothetical protein
MCAQPEAPSGGLGKVTCGCASLACGIKAYYAHSMWHAGIHVQGMGITMDMNWDADNPHHSSHDIHRLLAGIPMGREGKHSGQRSM